MDMSFFRRNRPVAIDLGALLARTSAVQSTSPTARTQVRLQADTGQSHTADPHVSLFADDCPSASNAKIAASFAELPGNIFSPRQSN